MKENAWIHIYLGGTTVPPTVAGSFNHLVWDILKRNSNNHQLITRYDPQSEVLAKDHPSVKITYLKPQPNHNGVQENLRRWVKKKLQIPFKDLLHRQRAYLNQLFEVLKQSGVNNIFLWDTPFMVTQYCPRLSKWPRL